MKAEKVTCGCRVHKHSELGCPMRLDKERGFVRTCGKLVDYCELHDGTMEARLAEALRYCESNMHCNMRCRNPYGVNAAHDDDCDFWRVRKLLADYEARKAER